MEVLGYIWLTGIVLMLLYSLVSYYRLHRCVSAAIPFMGNVSCVDVSGENGLPAEDGPVFGIHDIFQCDAINTPFILGIIKPRIYLPSNLKEAQTEYVAAHEMAHIRRRDYWWKPLGFFILSVYWFHPLCWVSYILFCRDIEMACDEQVVKAMGPESKKAYAKALLSCSVKQKSVTACPLAFGEVGVKERIKSILTYKKPAFWVVVISIAVCIITAVCFLTDPSEKDTGELSTESVDEAESHIKPGTDIDVPAEVLMEAKQYVEECYQTSLGELYNYDYVDWRIEHLEQVYTYEDLEGPEGKDYDVYQLDYTLLSASPETVIPVGGMSVTEDGWVSTEYPDSYYLIFERSDTGLSFAARMAENDCHPGDELFTEDLLTQLRDREKALSENRLDMAEYASDPLAGFVREWAEAFVNRDGETIAHMASEEFREELKTDDLLMGSEGQYSFGFSSPWPWDTKQGYSIDTFDENHAEILYYAQTSDPHITCWKETLTYEEDGAGFIVTGSKLKYFDYIASGAEFQEAYPGLIDGTMMDYTSNGLGEALNDNASEPDHHPVYDALFEPESAAIFLLNLLDNPNKVKLTLLPQEGDGLVGLDITFLEDGATVRISMLQPYGENGIWVPVNYRVDVFARMGRVPYEEWGKLSCQEGEPLDLTGLVCIGEIPEIKLKMYGYNDAEVTGRGVLIDIDGNTNYFFDWYYTTPQGIPPKLYWDEEKRHIRAAFHTYTGTGVSAETLYNIMRYETETLVESHIGLEDYRKLLEERISYSFMAENKVLILTDRETGEELVRMEIPEGKVTGMEFGQMSEFILGEPVLFKVRPGYCLNGYHVARYDGMPTLTFEMIIEPVGYAGYSFRLGDVQVD